MTSGVFSMWRAHGYRKLGVFTEKIGVFTGKVGAVTENVGGSTGYLRKAQTKSIASNQQMRGQRANLESQLKMKTNCKYADSSLS